MSKNSERTTISERDAYIERKHQEIDAQMAELVKLRAENERLLADLDEERAKSVRLRQERGELASKLARLERLEKAVLAYDNAYHSQLAFGQGSTSEEYRRANRNMVGAIAESRAAQPMDGQ